MSFNVKYLLVIYTIIIALFFLTGCSTFEEKLRQDRQLICSPSYETLCAGWQI